MVDDTMRSGRSEANAPSGIQLYLQLFVSDKEKETLLFFLHQKKHYLAFRQIPVCLCMCDLIVHQFSFLLSLYGIPFFSKNVVWNTYVLSYVRQLLRPVPCIHFL